MSQSITLTAHQWRDLITPVLPCASNDWNLPVLNAVQIRTDGKWLIAMATDRFRVGVKRIEKHATDDDTSTTWPEFEALIPAGTVKSITAMLKPSRGQHLAGATFTVEDDRLVVEASGLFDLFDAARFTHHLETGEYPPILGIIREALATPADERANTVGINSALFADFKAAGPTLRILLNRPNKPLVLTNGDGFIGALMPRRIAEAEPEDWADVLDPKPASKPARKPRAKKTKAA